MESVSKKKRINSGSGKLYKNLSFHSCHQSRFASYFDIVLETGVNNRDWSFRSSLVLCTGAALRRLSVLPLIRHKEGCFRFAIRGYTPSAWFGLEQPRPSWFRPRRGGISPGESVSPPCPRSSSRSYRSDLPVFPINCRHAVSTTACPHLTGYNH